MIEKNIEVVTKDSMYRVSVKEDGIEVATYVSSAHLAEEKFPHLLDKVREEGRRAFLRNREDV